MMAATHRLGGLAAGVIFAAVVHTELPESGVLIAGAILGSILPDIDNANSSISRRWRPVSLAVSMGQAVTRGISNLLPGRQRQYIRSLIGHRGITHSLIPVFLMPAVPLLAGRITGYPVIGLYFAMSLAAGILSHLLFDMLSGGVPLLIPFSVKRVCLAHIRTGGFVEWGFRIVLIIVFLYFGMEEIPWRRLLQV